MILLFIGIIAEFGCVVSKPHYDGRMNVQSAILVDFGCITDRTHIIAIALIGPRKLGGIRAWLI